MWKCISRGVKESLERGINFGKSDVRVGSEAQRKHQCCSKFTSFSGIKYDSWRGGKGKVCCDETKSEGHREGTKENTNNYFKDPKDTFLGAVSCSSALVLGWVLTQPYCHLRKWWCDGDRKCLTSCCPILYPFQGLSRSGFLLVGKVAFSQPITLPQLSSRDIHLCNGSDNSLQYGPLTAEQALDEAANELRQVHESTISAAQNRRGVEFMSKKRHREGVALFRTASENYPPAAYNLAQCYELGLGTKQDFKMAAEWYQKAAEAGHPGAMYNLAVFYAHGWGGLEASPAKARQLLAAAADKGQPDARAALGKTNQPPPSNIQQVMGKEEDWTNDDMTNLREDEEDSYSDKDYCSTNPDALYHLAKSFENSSNGSNTDCHMILDLYKFASDLGHGAAKARLHILQAYDSIGLLTEFLWGSKSGTEICDLEQVFLDSVASK